MSCDICLFLVSEPKEDAVYISTCMLLSTCYVILSCTVVLILIQALRVSADTSYTEFNYVTLFKLNVHLNLISYILSPFKVLKVLVLYWYWHYEVYKLNLYKLNGWKFNWEKSWNSWNQCDDEMIHIEKEYISICWCCENCFFFPTGEIHSQEQYLIL